VIEWRLLLFITDVEEPLNPDDAHSAEQRADAEMVPMSGLAEQPPPKNADEH
jgi:hypothetical protein